MQLQDLKNYLDIDIAESLEERFMDEEAFYLRFLRKLLVTQDFALKVYFFNILFYYIKPLKAKDLRKQKELP